MTKPKRKSVPGIDEFLFSKACPDIFKKKRSNDCVSHQIHRRFEKLEQLDENNGLPHKLKNSSVCKDIQLHKFLYG